MNTQLEVDWKAPALVKVLEGIKGTEIADGGEGREETLKGREELHAADVVGVEHVGIARQEDAAETLVEGFDKLWKDRLREKVEIRGGTAQQLCALRRDKFQQTRIEAL